jgi:hypothetical protein
MGISMTKFWHCVVWGAAVLCSLPFMLQFNSSLPEGWFGLFGIVWFFSLIAIAKRAWAVLFIGWSEDVKIERWKRSGVLR